MANNLNVSIETQNKTSNSIQYRVVVGVNSNESAWFGLIGDSYDTNYLCVVNHDDEALRYVGYPERSRWPTYTNGMLPYSALTNQANVDPVNCSYGGAPGYLIPRGQSYYSDWQTVSISRGNNRKGTKTIVAGIRTRYPNDSMFGNDLVTVTLETTEIGEATFTSNPGISLTDTTLTISGTYTNPDNYYRVRIYDGNTAIYTTPENQTSYSYTINLTEPMYGTTKTYTVKFIGKNGSIVGASKSASIAIPLRAFNIWMKQNGNINKDKRVYFKNVSNKEPKDIWVKKNNQIHKVKR